MYVWVNRLPDNDSARALPGDPGWLVPEDEPLAPASDRGLTLGDALFETILVRDGQAPLLPCHQARLAEGCRLLGYPAPPELDAPLQALIRRTGVDRGVFRFTCTRGSGPRGYHPPERAEPLCFAALSPLPPGGSSPWRAVLASHPIVPHPVLSRVKHTSALPRIVALGEARTHGAHEVLFRTVAGFVSEGTSTNVFWVKASTLYTPAVEGAGCLPGVARRWVLEWAAREGVEVREGTFPPTDLLEADEAFLTNGVRGPIPLAELSDPARGRVRVFRPSPGPLTARLTDAWQRHLSPPSAYLA